MFTKKDFEKAAMVISTVPDEHKEVVVSTYLELFKKDNPRFNEEKFLSACFKDNTATR